MANHFDESLFEPPSVDSGMRMGRVIWGGSLVAVVLVVGAVWSGFFASDTASTDADTPVTVVTSRSLAGLTTTTVPPVILQAFTPDPALLHHPTLLPEGWETCRRLEDKSKGDRFCNLEDKSVWLQIAVKDSYVVRLDDAPPTGDAHGGVWLENGERIEAAYWAGQFLVVVVSTNGGMTPNDVLAISASIPLVGSRSILHGTYELPLDVDAVSDEPLAGLVSHIDPDPRVAIRRPGEFQIYTETGSLQGFANQGYTVPDFGPDLPFPYLLVADRPLVVGESPSRGIAYAVWDQLGFGWRLQVRGTAETAEGAALEAMKRIAALETN